MRAPPRAEGLPRRRRQPHRGRRAPVRQRLLLPRPYRDCRGKAFNPARYAGGRTFPCLKAGNFPRVPVVLAEDRNAKKPAWLNDVRRYHNRGDIDFSSCSETCFEQGDFFGLDDLFTEQPAVVNGLAQVYGDWIRRTKVDGFRIDTARHVDRAFFKVWAPKILAAARAAGVPDFELFGEVFNSDAIELSTLRARPQAPERARLPVPGRGLALRRRRREREGDRRPARRRRLLPGAERRRAHAADVPRQPRHGPGGADDQGSLRRQERRPSCSGASSSATA